MASSGFDDDTYLHQEVFIVSSHRHKVPLIRSRHMALYKFAIHSLLIGGSDNDTYLRQEGYLIVACLSVSNFA